MQGMKKGLASLALAGSLLGATVGGAFAAPPENVQRGGAAGLVAAVVQLVATDVIDINDTLNDVQVGLVNVNNSLNNLTALNNVLNNSPILSNNNIDVVDVIDIDDITITVLDDGTVVVNALNVVLNDVQVTALNNFLNNSLNDLDLDALIGIAVLSTGDLILIQR